MTDQEINEDVARKLGFTPCEHEENVDGSLVTNPKTKVCERLRHYCHDIAAAWEIVEFVAQHHLVNVSVEMGPSNRTTCTIWKQDESVKHGKKFYDYGPSGYGIGAPMAICKAFLAMEDK